MGRSWGACIRGTRAGGTSARSQGRGGNCARPLFSTAAIQMISNAPEIAFGLFPFSLCERCSVKGSAEPIILFLSRPTFRCAAAAGKLPVTFCLGLAALCAGGADPAHLWWRFCDSNRPPGKPLLKIFNQLPFLLPPEAPDVRGGGGVIIL